MTQEIMKGKTLHIFSPTVLSSRPVDEAFDVDLVSIGCDFLRMFPCVSIPIMPFPMPLMTPVPS